MLRLIALVFLIISPFKAKCKEDNKKPNVILILTDDQDIELDGMRPMENVMKLIANEGATFQNAYTSSPLCCPSRASLLSGKYPHNHHTFNNSISGGCYGPHWRSTIEPQSMGSVVSQVGYRTFYAGKYLNQYYGEEVPPGWQEFFGLHGNSRYYNFTLRENEQNVSYSDYYLTDLLRDKFIHFYNTHKEIKEEQPFFALIAPPAPHDPYTPAKRHENKFANAKAPRTPSFNKMAKDKHWLVASSAEISSTTLDLMDSYYQKRLESLLAVDELVEALVKQLEDFGELDNTYIIYTSDNGYHLGQFAQPFDKRQPYETDIHIPLYIRGPSIAKGVNVTAPVLLIDLLPTIMEWSQIPMDPLLDGQTLQALIMNSQDYNALQDRNYHRGFLVHHVGEGNYNTFRPECGKMWQPSDRLAECRVEADCHCQDSWNNTYSCIRNFGHAINHLYCEFQDEEDFVEFYDIDSDPYQLNNARTEMLPIERALYSLALGNLTKCVGVSKCSVNIFQ